MGTSDDALRTSAGSWAGRPTFAIVNLDALRTNVQTLRRMIGPDVRLMAVVKANGYGHGAVPIGQIALEAGADELAVATVDEGVQLRAAGITAPVLVLGPIGLHERGRAIGHKLGLVISDAAFARGLAAEAKLVLEKDPVSVHLKIDTGMRRFGVPPDAAIQTAQAIMALPELRLDSVMTHLAAADDPDPAPAEEQIATFDRCVAELKDSGIDAPRNHAANSAGTLRFPAMHRDMVRVGIALYGLRPDHDLPLPQPMRPVMTLHSRISRIIDLQPGDTVSYGRTYRAEQPERAGLVPIGYADGYRRALSSRGWMTVGVNGQRADVLGRVCMDQTVIRLPMDDVELGQPVTVAGDGTPWTSGAPSLDDLAELTGTISYEMATGITARVPRLYVRDGSVVAIADLNGYREL